MIRNLVLTLAFAVVVGLAAEGVFARGGGHGGGHAGGHHGGAHHNAGHHANHHHHAHYAHHNRPFTHGWYGNHHGAWGGWGWGAGNAWAPAAFGTAAAWLGLSAANSVAGGYQPVETVYTADQGDQDTASNDDTTPNGDEPSAQEAQPQNFAPAAQAAELVKSGVADPPKDAKLLPLGVYSLAPKGQQEASAMVQLSVSKDGIVRGSYYDLLSNQAHPVQGAVDKKTQRVAWTVGSNGKVLFETSLANLTQETGPLSVHYENGQSRQWTVAQYEGEEDETADKAEAPAETKSN